MTTNSIQLSPQEHTRFIIINLLKNSMVVVTSRFLLLDNEFIIGENETLLLPKISSVKTRQNEFIKQVIFF